MTDDWVKKFMTEHKCFIAWDETQANELGRFLSYDTAKEAILEHAKTLNKKEVAMDFQVGDKVVCLAKGFGVVENIFMEEDYCLDVIFDNGDREDYTKKGYRHERDANPSLFHKGTIVTVKPAEPKRYPWVNIYYNGNNVDNGVIWETKERAVAHICEPIKGKYVDTIQLKPKGE